LCFVDVVCVAVLSDDYISFGPAINYPLALSTTAVSTVSNYDPFGFSVLSNHEASQALSSAERDFFVARQINATSEREFNHAGTIY
jgi:hypothetical protein